MTTTPTARLARGFITMTALLAILVSHGAIAAPASPAKFLLRLKRSPGQVINYSGSLTGTGTLTSAGEKVPLKVFANFKVSHKVLAVRPGGDFDVSITISDGSASVITAGKAQRETLRLPAITQTVASDGRVMKTVAPAGPESPDSSPAAHATIRFVTSSGHFGIILPADMVSAGDEWTSSLQLSPAAGSAIQQRSRLVGIGKMNGRDCLRIETSMTVPISL